MYESTKKKRTTSDENIFPLGKKSVEIVSEKKEGKLSRRSVKKKKMKRKVTRAQLPSHPSLAPDEVGLDHKKMWEEIRAEEEERRRLRGRYNW
jgi:hypothetical protein